MGGKTLIPTSGKSKAQSSLTAGSPGQGEKVRVERGGLRNGRDEHGVEAAPSVLRGQREGNFSYSYPLLPLARRWENSSCGQSFSGNFKMHEMQFPAQKIFAGLNA